MGALLVTVVGPKKKRNLNLPADKPIGQLLPALINLLGDSGSGASWSLGSGGKVLPSGRSLSECGIHAGDVLELRSGAPTIGSGVSPAPSAAPRPGRPSSGPIRLEPETPRPRSPASPPPAPRPTAAPTPPAASAPVTGGQTQPAPSRPGGLGILTNMPPPQRRMILIAAAAVPVLALIAWAVAAMGPSKDTEAKKPTSSTAQKKTDAPATARRPEVKYGVQVSGYEHDATGAEKAAKNYVEGLRSSDLETDDFKRNEVLRAIAAPDALARLTNQLSGGLADFKKKVRATGSERQRYSDEAAQFRVDLRTEFEDPSFKPKQEVFLIDLVWAQNDWRLTSIKREKGTGE